METKCSDCGAVLRSYRAIERHAQVHERGRGDKAARPQANKMLRPAANK